ncbi:DUF349 domain-containing protein [Maribacter halichondriae]|uniref:DUF349 domain-containing protein n=1 Tax=Maribacter halichondriae TaxID=2980554 RepID=UPI00235877F7|nr:DUF349 domain-containing protein [Maribacter sp. Hal144]
MLEENEQDQPETAEEQQLLVTTDSKTEPEKSTEMPTEKEKSSDALPESDTKVEENTKDESDKVLEEIDEENAEDAEDADNHHRHHIPILDYHSMSMENLVGELQRLIRNEKVQAIRKHVDGIKHEFDLKFQEFLEHKKEDFIGNGGNEVDFRYNSVTKRQFNEVYKEYREKRNQYYKNLEKSHKQNLADRLQIIEELKGLVNVEEDINTTYRNFKDIQERWRNAGPVPRTHYNDVWKTYHHHIEIFYDFLHINRELRDLDFKHNLEEKTKIAEQAEALANEPDMNKAFRELQTLHKIWKEDIGPVGQEHREAIWERFSNATKAMHQRRQAYYNELEKSYEQNLVKKQEIIDDITKVAAHIATNHKALQQQIKQIEELRNAFFKAGKVPQRVNEQTWASFKEAVRSFNRSKNSFYKNLKSEQQKNLDQKRELLNLAISLKDSEEWNTATQEMKRIQAEWKKIGHVPRKFSDSIRKEFKAACNHYFDRLHALKNVAHKEEAENLEKKNKCLETIKTFELSGDRKKDLAKVKGFIDEWKTYGRVPFNKKNIDQKFNKTIDALFRKLNVGRQEAELLKYGNKIQQLAKKDDEQAIYKERTFIRRKIEESKNEIRQLENNLQFFSNASEDNPLVQDVIKRVETHKASLTTWKEKLKKLNILENNLNKADEEIEAGSSEEE